MSLNSEACRDEVYEHEGGGERPQLRGCLAVRYSDEELHVRPRLSILYLVQGVPDFRLCLDKDYSSVGRLSKISIKKIHWDNGYI